MPPEENREKARPRTSANPILRGINDFMQASLKVHVAERCGYTSGQYDHAFGRNDSYLPPSTLPKRFTIYEPLLLLNADFQTYSPVWQSRYVALNDTEKQQLYEAIIRAFQKTGKHVTHIACTAPIALHNTLSQGSQENTLRAPTGLEPLYGDFGPTSLADIRQHQPSQEDFDEAFWVGTTQLRGLKQTWAPRWTMFSRGNIREKARILADATHNPSPFPGLVADALEQPLADVDVVDFYVGIGYFALAYLKRGVRRVFGWELNGWSVEGLRRGCASNRIGCRVFEVGNTPNADDLARISREVLLSLQDAPSTRCIVFRGDNKHATNVMSGIEMLMRDTTNPLNVRHCNLGLLPSSKQSYKGAIEVLSSERGGWLHVHENAEIAQIEMKRREVIDELILLARRQGQKDLRASCEHTELVKTFAPGVGHYVFDVKLGAAS